jgi:2,4-dienoyl-CoA reductase-like NADH-dependent reductase (Old Yellow Enzyme family)
MTKLLAPLVFACGARMRNRFMMAPLTNLQSHDDGRLSEAEYHWLTLRARGGFGAVMTCAAHVQARGQGFPGQLGVFDDRHEAGLARLARAIRDAGSLALCQLHHAGARAPADLIATAPVAPSNDPETGARALTEEQVAALVEDFVAAAVRCDAAGFDGVELHGAHGYLLCDFLAAERNHREDRYGGSRSNRERVLREIIDGVRARCRPGFCLGVRLSPERFGIRTADMVALAGELMAEGRIDFLDLSLWDVFKAPEDESLGDQPLLSWFTGLNRHGVRLGAAGKLGAPADAERALEWGLDFAILGRAAIVHHDFPARLAADPAFEPLAPPFSEAHLRAEGVSDPFLDYLKSRQLLPIAN